MNASSKHKHKTSKKKFSLFFIWQNDEELYVDKMHKTSDSENSYLPMYTELVSLIQYIIPWDRKWYKNVQIL